MAPGGRSTRSRSLLRVALALPVLAAGGCDPAREIRERGPCDPETEPRKLCNDNAVWECIPASGDLFSTDHWRILKSCGPDTTCETITASDPHDSSAVCSASVAECVQEPGASPARIEACAGVAQIYCWNVAEPTDGPTGELLYNCDAERWPGMVCQDEEPATDHDGKKVIRVRCYIPTTKCARWRHREFVCASAGVVRCVRDGLAVDEYSCSSREQCVEDEAGARCAARRAEVGSGEDATDDAGTDTAVEAP